MNYKLNFTRRREDMLVNKFRNVKLWTKKTIVLQKSHMYYSFFIIMYLLASICLIIELFLHDFWHLEWQLEPLLSNLFWNFPGISHFPSSCSATAIIPAILLAISQGMTTSSQFVKQDLLFKNLLNGLRSIV